MVYANTLILSNILPMKKFIKNYFAFTRRESIGISVLLLIISILIIYLMLSNNGIKLIPTDYSEFEKDINLFESQIRLKNTLRITENNNIEPYPTDTATPFNFNPNTIDSTTWLKLGFLPKQVKSIFNYKRKGGKFYSKKDVQKMYSIDSVMYKKIEPYIQIPNRDYKTITHYENKKKESNNTTRFHEKISSLNLNTADSAELNTLKGIGPVLAARIIKRRNELGGYINKNQLSEIYGLKPEVITQIESFVYIDHLFSPNKININTATYEVLKKHPYINHALANAIVSYRQQHGNYKKIEDVRKIHLVTAELYSKIAPYISIE
ncbi:hypothetical protein FLAV_01430 [Flavobacteriales bacterium]|nr:hypothetical protein [Flavobacteriales bacterium]CAG0974687.1 hypothetical protein FLAV_01430 [Flavobacteriales bacterium]